MGSSVSQVGSAELNQRWEPIVFLLTISKSTSTGKKELEGVLSLNLPLRQYVASYPIQQTHTHTKKGQCWCHSQLVSTSGQAFVIMSAHSCKTIWRTDQREHRQTDTYKEKNTHAAAWLDYRFIKCPLAWWSRRATKWSDSLIQRSPVSADRVETSRIRHGGKGGQIKHQMSVKRLKSKCIPNSLMSSFVWFFPDLKSSYLGHEMKSCDWSPRHW